MRPKSFCLFLLVSVVLSLSGCGGGIKTLSKGTAENLLFQSLQRGAAGDMITPKSSDLSVETFDTTGTARANGTVTIQMALDTYRGLTTAELPNGKKVQTVEKVRSKGEQIAVETTARFALGNDGNWQLDGMPRFNIRTDAIGEPLASLPYAIDRNSDEGKKFTALFDEFNATVNEYNAQNAKLKDLLHWQNIYVVSYAYSTVDDPRQIERLFPDEFVSQNLAKVLKFGGWGDSDFNARCRRTLTPLFANHITLVQAQMAALQTKVNALKEQLNHFNP